MGRAAGVSAEEFKTAYEAALNEHQPGPSDHFELTIGPTHVDADGCESHSYELNLYNWLGQWRCAPFNETPICFG